MALPLIRVGCSVPNQAFTTGKTPPWYDAGLTQDQGDSAFSTIVGRSLGGGGRLAVTKKFWNEGDYAQVKSGQPFNNMALYASYGTRVIVCLWPTVTHGLAAGSNFGTSGTSAQQANSLAEYNPATNTGKLPVFLQWLASLGFTTDTCRIVIIQEPGNANKNISAVDYANALRTYGPAVNDVRNGPGGAVAWPLIANVNYSGNISNATDYARAALGVGSPYSTNPTGCTFLGLAMDFYTNSYYGGHNLRLDTTDSGGYSVSGIADTAGVAFGLHEVGCVPQQIDPGGPPYPNCTAYMQYILAFMKARQNAGKPCLDVIYYNGQGPPTGTGDITSPIGQDPFVSPSGSSDFRVKLWQNIVDGLAAASPSFTQRQSSQNFAAPGGTGVLSMWNNQVSPPSPSAATLAGSMLMARVTLNDCQVGTTVTGPAGWILAPHEGKAGTANGNARVQTWYLPNCQAGLYGDASHLAVFTCSDTSATVKGKMSEWTTPAATVQALDQSGGTGAVASTTSMGPVACTAANIFTGDLAVATLAATLTGGTTGQTFTTPGGWTADGSGQNATNVFEGIYLNGTAAGTTTVTGTIAMGTWTMTSWAAAVATFYAAAALPLADTTGTLPGGTLSVAYSAALSADGGVAPYTFAQSAGTLPPGLTLSAGVLAGTPTTPGSYTFTVTLTDCSQQSTAQAFTVVISSGASTLAITTTSLPGGVAGSTYAAALAATGGTAPYTWAVAASALPPGVTLGASTGAISGTLTTPGTYTFAVSVTDAAFTVVNAVFTIVVAPALPQLDSLIIADQIELLGGPGGVPSTNPACAGAVFKLQPGYDLGAPQPTADFVASLILDGERPFGFRASNRAPTLPIMIVAPDFATLAGAFEVLMQAIDQQAWTLTWTRAGGLPLILDCFRAMPTVVTWGGADQTLGSPVGALSLTFSALPYGRSDTPTEILVASPLPGHDPPAAPVVLDSFSAVAGADNFLSGPSAGFEGGSGTWHSGANATIAVSTAAANTGLSSLAVTSVAAGNFNAASSSGTAILANGMPVTPGSTVTVSTWFQAAATARSVKTGVDWYDSTGTFITTTRGTAVTDSTTGWTQATALAVAPARAAVCRASPQILAAAGAAETHYIDDAYMAVTQWQPSANCVTGPQSANWDPCNPPIADCTGAGSQPGAYYTAPVSPSADITGLAALSVWAGFGSDFYTTWHKGPATFAFTLSDVSGHVLAFSRTMTVHASDDSSSPRWQRVTAAIPQNVAGFDYTAVSSYTVTVTNRGYHTLRYTQLYLDALTANPQSVQAPAPVRGAMYSLLGVQGTARTTCSAQFQQPASSTPAVTVALPGPVGTPQTWVCPPLVTSLQVQTTGGGGGGASSGGGGGGGEFASEAAVAVTPGALYTYTIGAGGQFNPPIAAGASGGATVFTGDSQAVTAHGGAGGSVFVGAGGPGASGSTNAAHHNGGNGAALAGSTGGGGGGSAGSTGAGGNASGATGGTAGTGTPTGAAGGGGGTGRDGFPGAAPGAGGGGTGNTTNHGAAGAPGQILLTYTPATPPFSTLIAHMPGPAAPPDLSPLVTFGATDVPNGSIEYPVPSLTPGVYADFAGTYTVVAVANAWNSPGSARTVTLTVKQYEYAGGPSYSTSVTRTFTPSTDTFLPGGATLAQVPIVTLGELTLPLQDIAPDNTSGLFTITITDSNTSDTWLDCLFLDTTGSTVTVGIPTAGAYNSLYADEPDTSVALGRVLGSTFGRAQAVSVMQNALMSGGPLFLTPGDNLLLVYAIEGAPALTVSYTPRWHLDRLS